MTLYLIDSSLGNVLKLFVGVFGNDVRIVGAHGIGVNVA